MFEHFRMNPNQVKNEFATCASNKQCFNILFMLVICLPLNIIYLYSLILFKKIVSKHMYYFDKDSKNLSNHFHKLLIKIFNRRRLLDTAKKSIETTDFLMVRENRKCLLK